MAVAALMLCESYLRVFSIENPLVIKYSSTHLLFINFFPQQLASTNNKMLYHLFYHCHRMGFEPVGAKQSLNYAFFPNNRLGKSKVLG